MKNSFYRSSKTGSASYDLYVDVLIFADIVVEVAYDDKLSEEDFYIHSFDIGYTNTGGNIKNMLHLTSLEEKQKYLYEYCAYNPNEEGVFLLDMLVNGSHKEFIQCKRNYEMLK